MSLQSLSGKPEDFTAWAKIPPAGGARGSRWEQNLLELAEAGEPRFIAILRDHVERGVIVSARASAALNAAEPDATA